MKKSIYYLAIITVFLFIGIGSRLWEHPANFVPLGAIALVSGYYFQGRYSWVIPLGIRLISDILIGLFAWQIMIAVYLSHLAMWAIGRYASKKQSSALIPGTLLGSIIFFVITNFAVWLYSPLYAKSFTGLWQSYLMAIPFFKWTLASDVLYSVTFIGVIEGVTLLAGLKKHQMQELKDTYHNA